MRWQARKPKPDPKPGDTRVVREFLFLPLTIGGETRWLELVWIKQEYRDGGWRWGWRFEPSWQDVEWAEPEKGPPNPRPVPAPRPMKLDYGGHKPPPTRPRPNVTPGGRVGGRNEKPVGKRPDPPPAPPKPLHLELFERGLDEIVETLAYGRTK